MPKLELELKSHHSTHVFSHMHKSGAAESRHWSRAHKVSNVCMCVCVQLPRADRLLRFSIENASKRLDYPAVVYRGSVPTFCRCCHPTGRWLPALKAKKHSLIEEPLTGAVFESVEKKERKKKKEKRDEEKKREQKKKEKKEREKNCHPTLRN